MLQDKRRSNSEVQARETTLEEQVEAINRIALVSVKNHSDLCREIDLLALNLNDMMEDVRRGRSIEWWRFQDILDDVLGMRDYVKAQSKT